MKTLFLTVAFAISSTSAIAGDAPKFFSDTYPSHALGAALKWYGTLGGKDAKLDAKARELVALGVAAQLPCSYCVHAHTAKARAAGATDAEIREAVAMAAAVRHWSTILNGMNYDLEAFKAEYDKMLASN
ncbi:MAG: carboxymuconolactone decarboxylase family protein [Methyloceanibacter sp.]|uniref:carboxymuconolactone decarboxylase family protein n=1 Tax=Methyloceanibacter sp. TaxID=1965321 RepID=UPI003C492D30